MFPVRYGLNFHVLLEEIQPLKGKIIYVTTQWHHHRAKMKNGNECKAIQFHTIHESYEEQRDVMAIYPSNRGRS
jgi:hypothetical protein